MVSGEALPDSQIFSRLAGRLPKNPPASFKAGFQSVADGFRLTVETGQKETEAAFFPSDQYILDNPAPQKLTPTAKGLILDLKKDANLTAKPAQLKGVLELSGGRAFELAILPGKPAPLAAAVEAPETSAPTEQASSAATDAAAPAYEASAEVRPFAVRLPCFRCRPCCGAAGWRSLAVCC